MAEPAEYASQVSKYQVKKIPQQSSHCRLTLRRKRILLNAERLQRKEPGAAEVQDQMDIAGSMEDKLPAIKTFGIFMGQSTARNKMLYKCKKKNIYLFQLHRH